MHMHSHGVLLIKSQDSRNFERDVTLGFEIDPNF